MRSVEKTPSDKEQDSTSGPFEVLASVSIRPFNVKGFKTLAPGGAGKCIKFVLFRTNLLNCSNGNVAGNNKV